MTDLKHHTTKVAELGSRVARDLVMENTGTIRRRQWWIASSATLALAEPAAQLEAA